MKKYIVLFAMLVFAGCGGNSSAPAPKPAGVTSITCMNFAASAGQCVQSSGKAALMSGTAIMSGATTSLVSGQTVTTTFDGGDLSLTQWGGVSAVLNMTIVNASDTLFTGYIISHMAVGGVDGGWTGAPVSLQPGDSMTYVEGEQLSGGMTLGPDSIAAFIYRTDDTFTVDDSNNWTVLQIAAWIDANHPVPAAAGIINFNIVP